MDLCQIRLTFDPGVQLLVHELFGRGELAQSDLGRAVALTHRADHLLLLLLAHLGVDVDPGDFPVDGSEQKRMNAAETDYFIT